MQRMAHFDVSDLKLIYRVLHAHLMEHLELMDSDFFTDLQTWLQSVAGSQGVDVRDHAAWDAWLQVEHVPCEVRMAGRTVLEFPSGEG